MGPVHAACTRVLWSCQAEKARKNAETELSESSSHVTEINIVMQNLTNDKHRLEGDVAMMRQQMEDAMTARRAAEERSERLGVEVARLTDQLRQEHDAVTTADATRKKLELSLRELTVRLEEVESLGDGKKNVVRMQQRVSRARRLHNTIGRGCIANACRSTIMLLGQLSVKFTLTLFLPTALAWEVMQYHLRPSVRLPSVRPFVFTLSSEPIDR